MHPSSRTLSTATAGRACARCKSLPPTPSSIPRTTSCWPHRPPPARPRRRSFPYSPSSTRTLPRASACSTSHRSRHSSTTSSAVSPSSARRPRFPSGAGTAMSRSHARASCSSTRAASCRSRRNPSRRCSCTSIPTSPRSSATCASSSSTRFTPSCAPTAAGNVSASSNVSRVSHHATRVASGCRQPSATSSLPDASSAQVRVATPSSPASRMRSSAGACPYRTSSWERAPRKWRREKMRQLLRDAVS